MNAFFLQELIDTIVYKTKKGNIDNISRTKSYESFYFKHPEIKWSLLAGFVSRNAGWNMCDLEGERYTKLFSNTYRSQLFLTYERANALIFQDAYPQLLVYHYSVKLNTPLFHLLSHFKVSKFMEKEWFYFWKTNNQERLLYALIINEQNLIQKPVIEHSFLQKNVFQSIPYKLQDWFRLGYVLFPTRYGEIYGTCVHDFISVDSRIDLGKRLASILFEPSLTQKFIKFIQSVEPTGSRFDYEQFLKKTQNFHPFLRFTFPIYHHQFDLSVSWDQNTKFNKSWFQKKKGININPITDWYFKKQKEIEIFVALKERIKNQRK